MGMKAKTIKAVLRKKVDDWIASIDNEELRELVKKNTIVTGGCVASMLLGEKINDFDVYFTNFETTKRVAEYYVSRFKPEKQRGIPCKTFVDVTDEKQVRIVVKSSGVASEIGTDKDYEYFESRPEDEAGTYVGDVMQDPGEIQDLYDELESEALKSADTKPRYRPVFISTNAITLSDKIQIVLRFYGEPDEIHENYDFVHCTNYWRSKDGHLEFRPKALEALLSKELRYVGSRYPIASLIRVRKFIQRGWTINAGQILKMVMQLQELNLSDPKVLQDQLTGVDVAYFNQLISSLKKENPEKVNSTYLVEIIDRMF